MNVHVRVSSKELYNALKAVSKVLSNKSTVPALGYFLFEVIDGHLTVYGSDTEGTITTGIELLGENAGVSEPAKFMIEHKLILDGLKELPDEPIQILVETDSRNIQVVHSKGKFSMVGGEVEDFSIIENQDPEPPLTLEVESHVLVDGIRTVLPYAGNDELRPIISSVYLECKAGKLSFVASNANFLALQETINSEFPDLSVMISPKFAKILSDLADGEDMITVSIGSKTMTAEFGGYTVTNRLVEGVYPNYRGVFPTNNDKVIIADTRSLISSLKRATIFTNQQSSLIRVDVSNNQLLVKGIDLDYNNSAVETIDCEYSGEDVEIGFKAPFLQQCLSSIYSDEVKITLSDEKRPALLMPVDDEPSNTSLTILLMPMLINV